MTDLDAKYLTRPELYRESCAPRPITEHFVHSLRFRIIQDDPGQRDGSCQPWCVALRTAIHEAWDSYTDAEFTVKNATLSSPESRLSRAQGQQYTAVKVIRNIALELYRHTVPHEERIL